MMRRVRVLGALLGTLALWPLAAAAQSPGYPDRQVKLVVSSAAGTAPDIVARVIGPKLSERFRQPVIVENKSGANGGLAASEVARAAPDGYTLLVTPAGTMTANPYLYPKSSAGPMQTLSPVTQIATVDFIVAVRKSLGVRTMPALLALMKEKPGKMSAATTAHGSFPHLAAEMLKQKTGLDFLIVKNTGGANAGVMVAGDHADFVIDTSAVLQSFIDGDKMVALASSAPTRGAASPDLPTVAESGVKDFAISGWIGVAAPPNTPIAVRRTIQQAIAAAITDPVIQDRLRTLQFVPVGNTPEAFEALVTRERAQLGEVIRSAGLALD